MKICFMTSTYPRHANDGIGSFIKSLAQALVSLGHDVHVVAPYDPAIAPMDQRGVHVYRFHYPPWSDRYLVGHGRAKLADVRLTRAAPFLMPGFVASAVLKTLALHRRERFDLLHGHWLVPGGVMASAAARLTGLPLLISLHGSDVHFAGRNPVYKAAARFAYRRAAHITACSTNLYEGTLALGADASRMSVIPYGVDVERFARGRRSALRARLGLAADALVIGALGRLVYKKGFDRLLAAMPQVLGALPGARCVIGGDGDLRAELGRQAQDLGVGNQVLFAGEIPWEQAPDFYALCDVVAVPSVVDPAGNVDGLPNVLLEAMAGGRAVVASRVAGIPEVVTHGVNGLLAPAGDAQALASALIELLKNPTLRARLGAGAHQSMAAEYGWDKIAARFAVLYAEALAPQRGLSGHAR